MAINQNRNSVRVLRTTAVGHLVHENIPDLSIGTGSDFTIQLWVVKGKDTDGVLYSQEGGFSLQLVDGQAVFSLAGFATLSAGTDWKLAAHRQDQGRGEERLRQGEHQAAAAGDRGQRHNGLPPGPREPKSGGRRQRLTRSRPSSTSTIPLLLPGR